MGPVPELIPVLGFTVGALVALPDGLEAMVLPAGVAILAAPEGAGVLPLPVDVLVAGPQPVSARTINNAASAYIQCCLSLIHISEPTRLGMISYAVFCLKK